MYKNCVSPKVQEYSRSEQSHQSKESAQSFVSGSSKLLSYTVHPNRSHIREPIEEEEEGENIKKKKKRRKNKKEEQTRQLPTYKLNTMKG